MLMLAPGGRVVSQQNISAHKAFLWPHICLVPSVHKGTRGDLPSKQHAGVFLQNTFPGTLPILQSTGLTCTLSRKHDRFPDSAIGVEETSTFLNKWNALDFLQFHNMPLSKTCLPGEVALWKVHDQCIDIQTWPPKNMSKHGREPRLLDGSAEGHTPTLPQLCFCVGNFTVSINLHCDIWRSINIDTNQITFVEYCNVSFESKQATWNMTAA